jgi:transcription-repair coupling factor (superfamily II helicase)
LVPPDLTATLGDRTGLSADDLRGDEGVTDPLAPILPPEGILASRTSVIAQRVLGTARGRVDVSGMRGSASAVVVAAMARKERRSIIAVTADLDAARRLADDLGFLLRASTDESEDTGEGDVLVLAASESSPYADINPDRRAAMARMATLAHLAEKRPFRVLVVPAVALVRKVVPRAVVRAHVARVTAEAELDRDALVKTLSEAGYLRVPLVEDPGSFAVRGALVDLWPPNLAEPVRVELYGELVLSIKPFDPFEQKTRRVRLEDGTSRDVTMTEVRLAPAREAILARENVSRARDAVQRMADAIDMPTLRARALGEDVASGRAFFGAEGFLPAYYEALASIFTYLPDDAIVALDDPPSIRLAIEETLAAAERDASAKGASLHFAPDAFFGDEASLLGHLEGRTVVPLHRSVTVGGDATGLASFELATADVLDIAARDHDDLARAVKSARQSKGRAGTLGPLVRRIAHWQNHGLRVFVAARAETQAERLVGLLRHQNVDCRARLGAFDPAWLDDDEGRTTTQIVVGTLSRGVLLPADGCVLLTEEEIFGARTHRREKKTDTKTRAFLEDLRSLSVGDFVVHVEHGIGRYQGLVHKEVGGLTVDLLVVEYDGGKLYLPVYRLNQIQKYAAGESSAPKIDRLGGSTFARTKARAKKAVRQMADELLRLYAERQAQHRPALPGIDDEYRAFEATFPFDETPDQAKAIDAVNGDLDGDRPMDRLVCGDVGFGKTEVAVRAAFRAAMAGKQVALLCPTTVLAQQHFRTFEARLGTYPVKVRALSRFQTDKESKETLLGLKEGKIDVVIGTHRLLSKDVHFKDLGLLIVDEEQRFGVTHKERIKALRTQVDVLTLTATPIPRTLQMAVGGLRDLSLITTPPQDRRAVRTIVTRWDEQVVRDAVDREMARGGQIFYVYNRIEGIYERAQRLQQLVPQARIAVAHGQMTRGGKEGEGGALEQTMIDFVEGRYDILVATAIVESGLDIPRANTILIDRADIFGLSQLYQLRGRVGRSKERAYCYLIVPPAESISDEARARIEALERHTELGSGFQIASLDLELRGAGDILGGEQSGTVASVGFDLFCQMLEDTVNELRGEEVVHDVDPELSFDVSALLPEDYVSDVGVRLSLYKRLASAVDESHVGEMAEEMENRFGPPPEDARRLVQLMSLKTELRRLRVLGCEAHARSVTLHLREDTPLDPAKITELVRASRSPYRLTPDMRLTRRFDGELNGLANAETMLVELGKCLKV